MALVPNLIRLLIQQSRRGGGGGGYGGGGYRGGSGGGGGYGRAPRPEKSQWDYMETAAKKAFTSEVNDTDDEFIRELKTLNAQTQQDIEALRDMVKRYGPQGD